MNGFAVCPAFSSCWIFSLPSALALDLIVIMHRGECPYFDCLISNSTWLPSLHCLPLAFPPLLIPSSRSSNGPAAFGICDSSDIIRLRRLLGMRRPSSSHSQNSIAQSPKGTAYSRSCPRWGENNHESCTQYLAIWGFYLTHFGSSNENERMNAIYFLLKRKINPIRLKVEETADLVSWYCMIKGSLPSPSAGIIVNFSHHNS